MSNGNTERPLGAGVLSIILAAILVGASVWIAWLCTVGTAAKPNRLGAVVLAPVGSLLPSTPMLSVGLLGKINSQQAALFKSAKMDPAFPMMSLSIVVPKPMQLEVALAGVVAASCQLVDDDNDVVISSREQLNSNTLISFDRSIDTNVMGTTTNPRSGILLGLTASRATVRAIQIECQAAENPEQPTATTRAFSIDTALIVQGFGETLRPKATHGMQVVLPERVALNAPPQAMHVTYDGAQPDGEYVSDEDDALAPADAFKLTASGPVLQIQWDDATAVAVDNVGLFIAGGLFGLAIGALVDGLRPIVLRLYHLTVRSKQSG